MSIATSFLDPGGALLTASLAPVKVLGSPTTLSKASSIHLLNLVFV